MSDIIKLLPDSVANQIAAGEVIQRPASVIKELVENAIDAGARNVQIILRDAGRTLIQVVDDGCGMSDTDARMAFERHATSKITSANDLYSLHTMGFRGEALPSIAAVSQIDLRTMPHGANLGTRLIINASEIEDQHPEACHAGTNMMVKNLFFNIPVRRRFLKKDSVELANVMREFERLALVNIGVEFTIIHNDVMLHHLRPATFKQRILDLFGKNLERQLIPVETETSLVKISGYVGLPESARRRGHLQYLMVNGRNMRHPYFHKAIMQCYIDLIAADAQPNYFLTFTVEPETIDVNIHPTKNEIKFENEQPIWQILVAAVKESLSRYNAVPAIDFDRTDAPDIPPFNPGAATSDRPQVMVDTSFNPFNTPSHTPSRVAPADWEKLYQDFSADGARGRCPAPPDTSESTLWQQDGDRDYSGSLHILNRYIVAPARAGLMIVDQHRAHVNVLYHKYMAESANRPLDSQQLLFPETLNLSPGQAATLSGILANVRTLGFEVQQATPTVWTITAAPGVLGDINPADTLVRIIDAAENTGAEVADTLNSRIALVMARQAAVKPDHSLSSAEREQLLASLLSLPTPGYTPDGLSTFTTLTADAIASLLN